MLDMTGQQSLLIAVQQLLSTVMIPALRSWKKWGPLEEYKTGKNDQERCLLSLDLFIDFLKGKLCFNK